MGDGAGPAEDALEQATWDLYGVPPGNFIASRTRRVKELRSQGLREQATAVGALRKPSVAAAAINVLVRAEDPVVARLRDLGVRLRHAQSALDTAGLAALRGERDQTLQDWVVAARAHAGGTLTGAVEAEVRDTAVAALAAASAAQVALSGSLTRALSYSGLGEVDLSDAVARTRTGVVLTRIQGGAEEDDGPREEDDGPREEEAEPTEDGDGGGQDEGEGDGAADVEERRPGQPDADALSRMEDALAEAEEQVAAARSARRRVLKEAETATTRVTQTQDAVTAAKDLLARAEEEAEDARGAESMAAAALTDADAALADARAIRDEARRALEEVEDAR